MCEISRKVQVLVERQYELNHPSTVRLARFPGCVATQPMGANELDSRSMCESTIGALRIAAHPNCLRLPASQAGTHQPGKLSAKQPESAGGRPSLVRRQAPEKFGCRLAGNTASKAR